MKKNNAQKSFLFCLMLALPAVVMSGNAQAFVKVPTDKIDAPSSASNVTQTVAHTATDSGEAVKTAGEESVNKTKGGLSALKQKAKSYKETLKALKQDVSKTKEQVNQTIGEGESLYEDMTSLDSLLSSESESGLGTSEKDFQEAQQNRAEYRQTLITKITAERDGYKNNLDQYQQMLSNATDEKTRATLEAQIAETQEKYDRLNVILNDDDALEQYMEENDKDYASINTQISRMEDELASFTGDAVSFGKSYIKNLLGMTDAERAQKYEAMIANNFLEKDEEENPTTSSRIKAYRYQTLRDDMAFALDTFMHRKQELDQSALDADRTAKNMAAVDYQQTALNMAIQQRIEEVKILYNYTSMLVADMRFKTAHGMIKVPLKLRDYTESPAVFNLDNYVFSEKDIETDEDKTNSLDKIIQSLGGKK